jgi:hypothetical protein
MYRSPLPLPILALVAVSCLAAGCGKSPTAPEPASPPPAPVIQTPVEATITKIVVTKFPAQKSDGSDWDLSAIASSRRPDVYVSLQVPNQFPDFVSTTVNDAVSTHDYTFTTPVIGGLPDHIPYGSSRRVYVMDADFGGDDDTVGWITVNLPAAYRDDNARTLDYTFTDTPGRLSVRVVGTWSY